MKRRSKDHPTTLYKTKKRPKEIDLRFRIQAGSEQFRTLAIFKTIIKFLSCETLKNRAYFESNFYTGYFNIAEIIDRLMTLYIEIS